jgi:hypothetical protein
LNESTKSLNVDWTEEALLRASPKFADLRSSPTLDTALLNSDLDSHTCSDALLLSLLHAATAATRMTRTNPTPGTVVRREFTAFVVRT